MNKRTSMISLLLALLATSAPAAGQTVYNNGAPNSQAGNDIFNDFRAADDFTSTSTLSFDLVRFWGLLPTGFAHTPTIFWQILNDAGGGVPGGTALASGSVLASPTLRTSIGPIGFDSWQFDLVIGGQTLGPGIYWLALHDGAIGDITDSTLLWETTGTSSGSQFAAEFGPTGEWTGDWGGDLAFELHNTTVTPEPVTITLLGTGLVGLAAAKRRRRKSSQENEAVSPDTGA